MTGINIDIIKFAPGVLQTSLPQNLETAISLIKASPPGPADLTTRNDALRGYGLFCMIQVLPSLSNYVNHAHQDPTILTLPTWPLIKEDEEARVFQVGFALICHLSKPLTTLNSAYLEKRWLAATQAAATDGVVLPLYNNLSMSGAIITALGSSPSSYISEAAVVRSLLVDRLAVSHDVVRKVLYGAIDLVYSFSGMVAIQLMWGIVTSANNAALSLLPVAEDAVSFSEAYQEAKTATDKEYGPGSWQFARALNPNALINLETSKFPDLYAAANEMAIETQGYSRTQYATSNHATRANRELIRKRAKRTVGTSSITDRTLSLIGTLGGSSDSFKQEFLPKKRRRRDTEGSDSS